MKQFLGLSSMLILLFFSCKKKNNTPPNPNEEELITTFMITLNDSAGVQPSVTAAYRDPDGDGGNNPVQWDSLRLKANTTYYATILLLDESKSPVDTISQEVLAEGAEHLFCFTVSGVNTQIQRTDSDGTYEIGLQSKWTSGSVGSGNVRIVLKHQPEVKNGSCDPGDTDVDLNFVLLLE